MYMLDLHASSEVLSLGRKGRFIHDIGVYACVILYLTCLLPLC